LFGEQRKLHLETEHGPDKRTSGVLLVRKLMRKMSLGDFHSREAGKERGEAWGRVARNKKTKDQSDKPIHRE